MEPGVAMMNPKPIPTSLRGALEVLEMLTERLPPPEGKRHSLMIIEGGLKIVVWVDEDHWQSFCVDDVDLDRQDQDLVVDDVLTILASLPPKKENEDAAQGS